jgi:PsbP-like protein
MNSTKEISLLISITTFAILTAPLCLADSSSYRTYENPDYNFVVKYPENWTANETSLPTDGVIIEPINTAEAQRVGFFVGETQKTATTFGDFIRSLEEFVKPDTYSLFANSSLMTLSGLPAVSFIYSYDDGFKFMYIYTEFGDKAFSLQYMAEPEYFDDYLPVAKSIIDSFHITSINVTNFS